MIKPIVFSSGLRTAQIAGVGEAPGASEIRLRQPFVGLAGQHLTKIMHSAGLSRQDIYLTNVVKERPSLDENDISSWIKFGLKGAVWVSENFGQYIELLRGELLSLPSLNVVVAFGNVPLYALTGLTAVTKRRGSILESTLVPGMKVIPTIHPAAALREHIFSHFIKLDLQRAIEESKYKELMLPSRNLRLQPSYNDVLDYLFDLLSRSQIAVDIEVMNEEVSCICLGYSPTDQMSIPFHMYGDDYFTINQEAEVWKMIATLLESNRIKKIGQNIIFDASFLFRKYGIRMVNFEDTMIGQGIAYPDFPKGLDFITSVYTREPYYKDEGKKWFKMGGSVQDFWKYNAKDGAVCMEAWPSILSTLRRQENEESYVQQRRLIQPLMYMQARGMRVDYEGLQLASKEADARIIQLTKELHECCGSSINPNSPLQLKKYFYEEKGHGPYYHKGAVTTNDDAMKRLARKGVKEAGLIRDIRKISKLKNTYYNVTLSDDKRLRSAMNPIGTRSTRLSSGEDIFGEGGNVQNLPPEMQQFIIADNGFVLYSVDLGQAENRVTAYIAPEPLMIKSFESGVDLHTLTASFISGKQPDVVKREDKEDIHAELGTGEFTWRFWGKKANHSLNYDLGYKTFSLRFELPESQGKFLVERWHQLYPGIRQYHAWIRATLSKDRTLRNCFGLHRTFLDRWGDELFKEAYSWIPQSTVAQKINWQGVNYVYYNQQYFKAVDLLNQIHDSLLFQLPLDISWYEHALILLRIKRSLEQPIKWHGNEFIIPADFKMGLNMNDFHKERNPKGMIGVSTDGETVRGLSRKLTDSYKRLKACSQICKAC